MSTSFDIGAGSQCIDNRLGAQELEVLLANRPPQFSLVNVAIWYGTVPAAGAACCAWKAAGTTQCVDGPWTAQSC